MIIIKLDFKKFPPYSPEIGTEISICAEKIGKVVSIDSFSKTYEVELYQGKENSPKTRLLMDSQIKLSCQ